MNNLTKLSALVLGMFLFGVSQTFGQTNISDAPTDNMVELGGKDLYEHGYNIGGQDLPRESIDTVMVTSAMNYFVMPDKNYNAAYYGGISYDATNLTVSRFDWTIGNGSSFAPQSSNASSTSPWIKVTWGNTTGPTTITVKETPQGLPGTCDSQETEIDVIVIAKPTIGFNQTGTPLAYAASDCYTDVTKLTAYYDFPVIVTTSSSQILVNYSIKKKDLLTGVETITTETDVPVSSGAFRIDFTDYGEYEVTITQITDRIARKCEVFGDINAGQSVFTYSVLPQPQTGPIYHVPNMFN